MKLQSSELLEQLALATSIGFPNPYEAQLNVTDSTGNMAMGNLPVTVKDSAGNILATGTSENGTAQITLPAYYPSVTAIVGDSIFYTGSSGTGTAQYDLTSMIQTQGPAGTDPVTNAKWTIIRDYVEHSGAFTYNSATGNYSINNNDACYLWTDTVYNVKRGYCLALSPDISSQELNSSTFDNQEFMVNKFWGSGGALSQSQENNYLNLTKMQFFDLWLGLKLQPESYGGNPSDPSGFTGLDSLASDFAALMSEPQSYFQNGGTTAQDFSAQVQGLLTKATSLGFPTPQGVLEQLADFVNSIINAFLSAITAIWNAIVSFDGEFVNFVMTVWNFILGPVLGAAIEEVKSVVTMVLNQILNTVTHPMLSGQTTSLSTLFNIHPPHPRLLVVIFQLSELVWEVYLIQNYQWAKQH